MEYKEDDVNGNIFCQERLEANGQIDNLFLRKGIED